jgi:UrcA family protein
MRILQFCAQHFATREAPQAAGDRPAAAAGENAMTRATIFVAATVCAALSAPALADPVRTAHVPIASYDLQTAEGRAALEAQVNRAIDAVCGKVSDPRESRKHEAFSCRRDTVPNVRAQLASLTDARARKVTMERSGGR